MLKDSNTTCVGKVRLDSMQVGITCKGEAQMVSSKMQGARTCNGAAYAHKLAYCAHITSSDSFVFESVNFLCRI